jgi:uncharacterized integral membrane protein
MAADQNGRDTAKIVAIVVIAIVLVVFVLANTRRVRIDFVVGDLRIPLIFVLVGTAILGAILDRLFTAWRHRRRDRDRDD